MNVAVVGSTGYIANFLLKRFENNKIDDLLRIDKSSLADKYLDLECADEFDYSCLRDTDYVIFTAAISSPDICADKFEFSWNINVKGTSYFIEHSIQAGCKVLFFSSDAVYGDIPGMVYNEISETNAETPYGIMKKKVEDTFRNNVNFKAIRLSYVVSKRDKFVSYCLKCMKDKKEADIYHPFYRNCIVVSDVVDVVEWLCLHWEEYNPWVLNVAGEELVSRVRIADELNRIFNNRLSYKISLPNESFYKNRPPITQMRSIYLQEYGILRHENFTEKIKREMEE